jgi:two-component system, OmpR family, alkaline phosphatase synthesis response regulator PhoP
MTAKRVLVVDDEEDLLELIRYNLAKEGFDVRTAATGEDALAALEKVDVELVLLDLMLPGMDGLAVCRAVKADPKTADVPIIMVTAKGEEADVVKGLALGADDYVTKPFSPKVLVARVSAVLRRRAAGVALGPVSLEGGALSISEERREVLVDGAPVALTATEFDLLCLLAKRRGKVFTRNEIIDSVKGTDYSVTERSVDVHVVGLRRKLGEAGSCVETVRGIGYRMKD